MPRLTTSIPAYCKHRASGQAYVKLNGQMTYLGLYRSKASRVNYDQVINQWLANGRRLPSSECDEDLTITQLCVAYFKRCREYYRKNGKPTDEAANIQNAIKHVRALYGDSFANEFGPKKLKVVRQRMIGHDLCRKVINKHVTRIKGMFRWGIEEELVPGEVYQNIKDLTGLKRGSSKARETKPIRPIDNEDFGRIARLVLNDNAKGLTLANRSLYIRRESGQITWACSVPLNGGEFGVEPDWLSVNGSFSLPNQNHSRLMILGANQRSKSQ